MRSYRTDNTLKKHERLCGKHDFCIPVMPEEAQNTLKHNSREKSSKVPNLFYLDLECLLEKTNHVKIIQKNHL